MIPLTTPAPPPNFEPMLRVLRIIVVALAFGVTAFGVVAISTAKQPAPPANGPAAPAGGNLVLAVLVPLMATASGLATAFIVPPLVTAAKRKQLAAGKSSPDESVPGDDGSQLMQAYQTGTIIRCALLEGPAFLNLFFYMTQQSVIALVLAGVLWLVLLAQFPRRAAVLEWLETQARRLSDDRSF